MRMKQSDKRHHVTVKEKKEILAHCSFVLTLHPSTIDVIVCHVGVFSRSALRSILQADPTPGLLQRVQKVRKVQWVCEITSIGPLQQT